MLGLWLTLTFKSSPLTRTATSVAVDSPTTTVTTAPEGDDDAPAGAPPPRQQTTAPPTPTLATRTVNGDPIYTRFGDVQVAVVLSGTRIVDVTNIQLPFDHQRSAYISRVAAPRLRQEVLATQNAVIDTISGATYTSAAYRHSLQSALDRAGG
jgi:uncharacterized protein with FMN-binding domain